MLYNNLNKLIPAIRINIDFIVSETSRKIQNAIINILRKSAYEEILVIILRKMEKFIL